MERQKARSEICPPGDPPDNPWVERDAEEARRRANARPKNPKARAARKAVERAIRTGRLVKQRCQVGGRGCNGWPVEAHHHQGLDQPLSIIWACLPCHYRLSAEETKKRARRRGGREEDER